MIKILILILYLIKLVHSIEVENENDLINILSKNNSDDDEIIIDVNSEIDIISNITIHNSINKISLIGESTSNSILNFKNKLFFDKGIKEIEIKYLTIKGNFIFNNNEKIIINYVNFIGSIDSNFDSSNEYIKISYFNYFPSDKLNINCINLSGNVEIKSSKFYGSSSCQNRILHFDGQDKYKLEILNSRFDGKKKCPCLTIENALEANIDYTNFKNAYSSKEING
eukprot:jgi/Orpsp1_1/1179543/evm.model.c7180000069815.1